MEVRLRQGESVRSPREVGGRASSIKLSACDRIVVEKGVCVTAYGKAATVIVPWSTVAAIEFDRTEAPDQREYVRPLTEREKAEAAEAKKRGRGSGVAVNSGVAG